MDIEKSLKEEQTKRKLVEDKLFTAVTQKSQQAAAASAESAEDASQLLELANEELSKKELSLRDSKRKSEIYEGHHLEQRSRPELQHAQKQLADVLKIIN